MCRTSWMVHFFLVIPMVLPVGISSGAQNRGKNIAVNIQVSTTKPDGRRWDSLSAPDINGKITFPEGTIFVPLHQDSYTASASGSGITLNVGDRIHVFLEDRDVSRHDVIASGFIEYRGQKSLSEWVGSARLTLDIR